MENVNGNCERRNLKRLDGKSTMAKIIAHDEEAGASSLLWDQVNCGKIGAREPFEKILDSSLLNRISYSLDSSAFKKRDQSEEG